MTMHDDGAAPAAIPQSDIRVPLTGGDTLNIRRFCGDPSGLPVLMVHGAIENGRIFHSRSGKGLAPFLASKGFDVYVADLRGHGESKPALGPGSAYGQTEAIVEDIPALVEAVIAIRGKVPQSWVAHSWGGILFNAFLARRPEYAPMVRASVYFGSKRTVRTLTLESIVKVHLIWGLISPIVAFFAGYLPAVKLGFGSDNDTKKYLLQCLRWVRRRRWIDGDDGFNYDEAIARVSLPPIWYIAAKGDRALGHPRDVRDFMRASGSGSARYTILSTDLGNLHDYDHISMLTHPDAVVDHFPAVAAWLRGEGIQANAERKEEDYAN